MLNTTEEGEWKRGKRERERGWSATGLQPADNRLKAIVPKLFGILLGFMLMCGTGRRGRGRSRGSWGSNCGINNGKHKSPQGQQKKNNKNNKSNQCGAAKSSPATFPLWFICTTLRMRIFFACATFNPARSPFLSYTPSLAALLFLLDFTFKSKLCYTLLHLQLALSLSPLPCRTGLIYLFVCLLLFLPHATAICIILRVCVCVQG